MKRIRSHSEEEARQLFHVMLAGALIALTTVAAAGEISGQMSVGLVVTGGAAPAKQTAAAATPPRAMTYTPGAGAISVSRAGYGDISLYSNVGATYLFKAARDGTYYYVGVSVSSGQITSVSAL